MKLLLVVDHSTAPPLPAGTEVWVVLTERGVTVVPS
jgi:hypothetical protein